MSPINRGKKFEEVIEKSFIKLPDVSIDRIHDQTSGYFGSSNIADFSVYRLPYQYYIECKSVHGNTLSIYSNPKPDKQGVLHGFYGNVTDTQWTGLLDKSKIEGVFAGIICWWIDKDITRFIPIQVLNEYRQNGHKSIRYDATDILSFIISGNKKRVYFDYDMNTFFDCANTINMR